MTNTMNAIASIFAGKGGTLKLTILGSLVAAVIYEIMDAHYDLNITTKEGTVSFVPANETGQPDEQAATADTVPSDQSIASSTTNDTDDRITE